MIIENTYMKKFLHNNGRALGSMGYFILLMLVFLIGAPEVWTSSDNECGFVNYRLSIFDNTLAPILIRFTSDTNFTIPFESLNLEESLISNYYWIYLKKSTITFFKKF